MAKIQEDPSLDSTTRRIKMQWVQNVENRRFRIDKARIEEDKKAAIERSQGDKQRAIRLIQGRIRLFAVVLPPLPALLLAFVIFARRRRRENLGAVESRMVRSS